MLEVIGAGNPDYKGQEWADVWATSSECKARTREIEEIVRSRRESPTDEETKDDREFAMPMWAQTIATTKRSFIAYWRSPEYIIVSFAYLLLRFIVLTESSGKIHVAHIYRAFQYFHLLDVGKQFY